MLFCVNSSICSFLLILRDTFIYHPFRFFHTNSNYRVSDEIDLLFTDEYPNSRPVVPYTPAESIHCQQYAACKETLRLAREIYPEMDKVVLDMNIPLHTPSRDEFCKFWRQKYGHMGETLEVREGGRSMALSTGVPLTPTSTSYVAFLYRNGLADDLYHFTNVLVHGSKPLFSRAMEEDSKRRLEEVEEYILPSNFEGLYQLDVVNNIPSSRSSLVVEILTQPNNGQGSCLIAPGRNAIVFHRGAYLNTPSPNTPPSECKNLNNQRRTTRRNVVHHIQLIKAFEV